MKPKYNKEAYLEAVKKMKDVTQGELEMAQLVEDDEHIEKMITRLDNFNELEQIIEYNYNRVSLSNSISNIDIEIFVMFDRIMDGVFDMEKNNRFLFNIIKLREVCRALISSYSEKIINREELDIVITLDNELDKLVPYNKNDLKNRGKYTYISNYIDNIAVKIS